MAGLGCGSYRFSNSVNINKSYVYVKLTESAHKSLEEYLKYGNCSKSQPNITFNGTEGEIKIPSQSHGGSTFKFQMQKVQDTEGPQGSFESIRQIDSYSLDSLGPLINIMRIQAKDDSYEKTRQSMANAVAQNGKTCVKELKPNGVIIRHRPTRPSSMVVPPHKKEPSTFASNPYSSHNGNTASSSPHRSSSGKPAWSAPARHPQLSRKLNEALKKRPLRERIIQLLALKPMNKLQLIQRIHAEGVKESDKRHISNVMQNIATVKDNTFYLPKHLWSEVNEDWSFYSEEEKTVLQRNKPQNLSPHERDAPLHSSHSPSSLSPSSLGNAPDTLKRPREPPYDPTVKKPRITNDARLPDSSSRPGNYVTSSSGSGRGEESPIRDVGVRITRRSKWQTNREEPISGDMGHVNGHSPSSTSVSPLSQNNSPRNPPYPTNKPSETSSLSNGFANQTDVGRNAFNNSRSDKKKSFNNHYNDSHINGVHHVQSSSPTSSPDSQQENKDLTMNFKEQYSKIENNDQRRQYKADFNRIYKEYEVLHADLEKTKLFFKDLESNLNEHQYETPEYHRIKQRMFDEYKSRQPNFQEKKRRYHHLDEVLKHIKQHVSDYDSSNRC